MTTFGFGRFVRAGAVEGAGRLGWVLRGVAALELLATLPLLAFGVYMSIFGKGMHDFRFLGWMVLGLCLPIATLDACVAWRFWRRALWARAALAFALCLAAAARLLGVSVVLNAADEPEIATAIVAAFNFALFWLGLVVLTRERESERNGSRRFGQAR